MDDSVDNLDAMIPHLSRKVRPETCRDKQISAKWAKPVYVISNIEKYK